MDQQTDIAVETSALTKVFGATRAVDGVDLTVRAGSVYGFLGPNGAGKTTTIRMLATLLRPDGGTARIFGHDVVREAEAVRGLVSLTGQFASVDEDLSGLENLILLGRLQGYSAKQAKVRAGELLDVFGLAEAASRQVRKYSGGMRRRLDIAASIIVTPDLLFLDEPTTGLDPLSRNQVWEIVRAIVGAGTTVLLTTQYLDEADQLSDRIAVIDHGKVIAEGTSAQLKASVGAGTLHVHLSDSAQRPEAERVLSCCRVLLARPCMGSPTRQGYGYACPLSQPRVTWAAVSHMRSPNCHTLGSPSPTLRSASRASTRSSWRSLPLPPASRQPSRRQLDDYHTGRAADRRCPTGR